MKKPLLVLATSALGLALLTAPVHATTTTITASADAHVQADQPGTNYGTAIGLRVDGSPVSTAYLRFDVTGLSAPPFNVKLRVFVNTSGSTGVTLSAVDGVWTESGLTYSNAPAVGAALGASGALTAGTWVSYDVTTRVSANGSYSFALTTTSSSSRTFDSRESVNPPQLVVEDTAPPPAPGPADAYVQADQPSSNFGTATILRVDASPATSAYLRFDVTGLSVPPFKATLRVFNRTSGTTGLDLYFVPDTSWHETGITYANAPPTGNWLASSGSLAADTWVSFDVTTAVRANGKHSFAITTTSTSSRTIDSREGSNEPELVFEDAPPPPPPGTPVVMVAGDAACAPDDPNYNGGLGTSTKCRMKAVSDVALAASPTAVFMVGDAQYNGGQLANFQASYDPTWGRMKSITRPVIGNHEYGTTGAGGYFTYFGDAATPRQPGCVRNCEGWYSFDIGTWHVVVLNSECARISGGTGCALGSPQQQWLTADLAAHPAACTAALLHKPRWSSNSFGSADTAPLIDTMYAAGVDLLLAGHAHSYERFAAQTPSGALDNATGIQEFVVGTGGSFFTGFAAALPNSLVRKANVFGALKLTLRPTGYDWEFAADPLTPFADSGAATCH
ncbi:DNRLRE domain-containing protein [Lentzea sp. NPDC051213]|uniref:CBM96 family carbohydrate-binding protein n=1 Tax=Lentzea sp. NPDC051213 TaxID=3364126 RepID=UPI0037A195DA